MIARGRRPQRSASSKARCRAIGNVFQLPGSDSMKTGSAPRYRIGFSEATQVRAERNIVSSRPMPNRRRQTWIVPEPEESAATPATPKRSASSRSQGVHVRPPQRIDPVRVRCVLDAPPFKSSQREESRGVYVSTEALPPPAFSIQLPCTASHLYIGTSQTGAAMADQPDAAPHGARATWQA